MKLNRVLVMGGFLLAACAAAGCGRQAGAGRQENTGRPESSPAAATQAPVSASPAIVSTPPAAHPPAAAPAPGEAVFASKLPPTAAGKPTTLAEAYPNYKPGLDDPELESTKTGRRKVAKHDIPLEPGGAPDFRTLLENVVTAIDVADAKTVQKATVTQADFMNILWPEMPQSRPAAQVPGAEAWDFLYNRNMAAFNRHMGDFHNSGLHLVSFEVGHVDEYTNYRLHQDVIIQAETADHQPVEMDVVRTVVERNGRFKVYSTRD